MPMLSKKSMAPPLGKNLVEFFRLFLRASRYLSQPVPLIVGEASGSEIPTIHIDVSRIAESDLGTGIQRATRQIARVLWKKSGEGVNFSFFSVDENGNLRSAWPWFESLLEKQRLPQCPYYVQGFAPGDVLFLLDPAFAPRGLNPGSIRTLRKNGVRIVSLVHDILPMTHPAFFSVASRYLFRRWFRSVKNSDHIITVSNTSKRQIETQFKEMVTRGHQVPKISVVRLSGEPESIEKLADSPAGLQEDKFPNYLFVSIGTVEPRKGYAEILDAFEGLWREGLNYHWWVFGKPGWRTARLQSRFTQLMEQNPRFKWFQDASDSQVQEALQSSRALISNSYAEGFGLPVAEALWHGIPVIARDIDAFREFMSPALTYYSQASPADSLFRAIKDSGGREPSQVHQQTQLETWEETGSHVLEIIMKEIRSHPGFEPSWVL